MRAASFPLIRSLTMNAWFSGLSAVLMLPFGGWIAAQLGLPGPGPVYVVAVILLLFAAQLANILRTGVIRTWEIVGIIAGDLGWVAASIVLVSLYDASISPLGLLLVDAIALIVLFLAVMQIRGLRHYKRGTLSHA